jgi:eukaryotic-like serine/threonine-protein kinase
VLFDEQGEGAGPNYSVYMRGTDGSPAVKLTDGWAMALSPDGRSAATGPALNSDTIRIVPTGAGEPKAVTLKGLTVGWGVWHPDGHRMLVRASQQDHLPRLYVVDVGGGAPRPITEEEARPSGAVSPDGKSVAVVSQSKPGRVIPFDGGEARPLPALLPTDLLMKWSDDGKSLFVRPGGVTPARIERIEVATGTRTLVKEINPADRAGLVDLAWFLVSGDGRSYVYSYRRNLGALYVGTPGN